MGHDDHWAGKEKRWKNVYTRSAKLSRAKQLGFEYPRKATALTVEGKDDAATATHRNVLFVCSRNQWRSPTAEQIWRKHPLVTARSGGTSTGAKHKVSADDVHWADVIFVMEEKHKARLAAEFPRHLQHKAVYVLDIPDDYTYMDPELVELLETTVGAGEQALMSPKGTSARGGELRPSRRFSRRRPAGTPGYTLRLAMRHIPATSYRNMPWRNGGGTTVELLREPNELSPEGNPFLYRLSIADVRSDGPFSRFEGYERHIMVVSGAGMTLTGGPHGVIDLRAPFQPATFSGDWNIEGKLLAGPVRDFNFMVHRARARGTLEVQEAEAELPLDPGQATVCIVHILEGTLEVAPQGDTLVLDGPTVVTALPWARVAIAKVFVHGRSQPSNAD
jgi:environmental stress-induced protein Ves/predicted protein tyrosine phosphatase